MELALLVYGISLLAGFHKLFIFIVIMLVLLMFGKLIAYDISSYRDRSTKWIDVKKFCKNCMIAIVVISSAVVFIPNEKTAYVMVGAYATQKIAQSPETKVISEKVLKVIENKLDEYITEPKPTK